MTARNAARAAALAIPALVGFTFFVLWVFAGALVELPTAQGWRPWRGRCGR